MVCFGKCYADCLLRLVFIFPVQAGILCMWTNDSQRLLLEHFDIIHNSPSRLYHSALPFCPSSSWLYEHYSLELSQEAKVVKGLSAEWGICFRTVLLNDRSWSLSYWNNTIAVGSGNKDILILDAITGSQIAVLPGHTDDVRSITFSSDGTSLVSGSDDKTVKLWDVQTGGVVWTFHGHTDWVWSVSISVDNTTIASGSDDKTLRLWNIQRRECHQIIEQQEEVTCVRFSPTNPQCLVSISGGTTQQWDIDGHRVGPTYDGCAIAFSLDGTQLILDVEDSVTVYNINSGLVMAEFHMANNYAVFCFSPDHKLMAAAAGLDIHVLNITGSNPYLVETFIGHSDYIISLTFSSLSTLVSASHDESIKFWQIGASSTSPIVTDPKSTPLTLVPTESMALKTKNGLIIPSDLPDGVIKTWGILTGLHKGLFQIPAQGTHQNNNQPVDNRLIFVWYADRKINIWDAEKGELLQTIYVPRGHIKDLRVSGDGSKVFYVYQDSIQAWDIRTEEVVGEVMAWDVYIKTNDGMVAGGEMQILGIEGSKIWVHVYQSGWYCQKGWDFGVPGSPPVMFSSEGGPPDRLHLNDTKVWETSMSRMKDMVTGKVVIHLPGRFGEASHVQWDGHYLVVLFWSKEVVILDFSNVSL